MTELFCKHGLPEVGAPDECIEDGGLFTKDEDGELVPVEDAGWNGAGADVEAQRG